MAESEIANAVLFIFVSLFLAFLGYELKKKLGLPVSPILLILGIFIRDISHSMGNWKTAFEQVDNIDPHLILFAMMPALIFEAGISTDWHTFRIEIGQILIMATTQVFLSALLTAGTIVYVLGYNFSWSEAFMLGVILSATDHVAVVAQLKEIYADKRFETLVQGETLLNEASVFVLFSIMKDSLTGNQNIAQSVALFFRLSLGGLCLGLAFSIVFSIVIKRMANDELQQTNLTLVTAYFLFFTADGTSVHVSGALAVVTFGLFMSAYGKTLISPNVEKYLHEFWGLISTCMESIIFIMGGMLLGMHFVESNSNLDAKDVGKMVGLYVLLHFIRGFAILFHYPFLQNLGYGLEAKEAVVLTLSGLKGAISTALALIAYNEPLLDQRFRSVMLFFTTGICALTIVFDGILMKTAVRYFNMEALTEVQENMLIGVTTGILQHTSKKVEHLRNNQDFNLVRWDFVMKFAGPKRLLVQIMKGSAVGKKILKRYKDESAEKLLDRYINKFHLTPSALIDETRRRYFNTLKGIYWHLFESGRCMGITALGLISCCNNALDFEKNIMNDWEVLQSKMLISKLVKFLNSASKIPLIGTFFKSMLNRSLLRIYDSAVTFINAHEEAESIMDQMEIDIDEEVFKNVMEEAHLQVKKCKQYLYSNIIDCYPDIAVQLQTKKACRCLLISQEKLVKKIYGQGIIQELEFKYLKSAINESRKQMKKMIKTRMPTLEELLKSRFSKAESGEIENILPLITEVSFDPKSVIFSQGDECTGGFLILRGRVREQSSWIKQDLMAGNIVGAQHLLPEYKLNTSTAIAVTQVTAAHLPYGVFKTPNLKSDLYKEASEEIILLNKECFGLSKVKVEHIFKAVSNSNILHLEKGENLNLNTAILLFAGEVSKKLRNYCLILPKQKIVNVISEVICLVLPKELSIFIQQIGKIPQAFAAYYVKGPVKTLNLTEKVKNADLIGLKSIHKLKHVRHSSKAKLN